MKFWTFYPVWQGVYIFVNKGRPKNCPCIRSVRPHYRILYILSKDTAWEKYDWYWCWYFHTNEIGFKHFNNWLAFSDIEFDCLSKVSLVFWLHPIKACVLVNWAIIRYLQQLKLKKKILKMAMMKAGFDARFQIRTTEWLLQITTNVRYNHFVGYFDVGDNLINVMQRLYAILWWCPTS